MAPSSPSRSRSAISPQRSTPGPPPFLIRIVTTLIPIFASLLLVTTVYLFHLHHAHHDPEDDASDLDHYINPMGMGQHPDHGGANSPGGSALRHKMDLANFLLQKYDEERTEEGEKEAMEMGHWRGGDEENFVKMVKEMSRHEDGEKGNNEKADNKVVVKDIGKGSHRKNDNGPGSSVHKLTWEQLQHVLIHQNLLPQPIDVTHTARGFSGLPPDETPALAGAKRGSIHCPNTDPRVEEVMSSMLAFWNEPRGDRDQNAGMPDVEPHVFMPPPLTVEESRSPKTSRRRYLTFEPDTGGWNNLRISLENMITLAAASGRTLVLPPEQVMYLLEARKGDERRGRNYGDFFNLTENTELLRRVPIITSEEFLKLEGGGDGMVPLGGYNATWQQHLWTIAQNCEERKKSDIYCEDLYDHFRDHGQLSPVSGEEPYMNCFIFDADVFTHGESYIDKISPEIRERISKFCRQRTPFFYNRTMHDAPLWHFETMDFRYRMLVHFYAFTLFTDPEIGNYYKRFVRDFLRYHDDVFCAAGKIILSLQYEDHMRGLPTGGESSSLTNLDPELMGGYSSLHIRRGDLQFTEVKFDSKQWYQSTQEIWKPGEILYVATDEFNKTFFDDFRNLHSGPLRFFDDYKELAGLDLIDPTLYGLIDTVVASRGTVFAGTWFSTFSGYIIRLRGYYGVSKFYSYYSWVDRKYFMHRWMDVGDGSYYAREYPTGWTSIDGDVFVDNDREVGRNPNLYLPRNAMDFWKERTTETLIANRYKTAGGDRRLDSAVHIANNFVQEAPQLGRGIAGRPIELTPALVGAKRGHMTCDTIDNRLAYWNEPQGTRDEAFVSAFADNQSGSKPKYLVFTADKGGFNNVRMSFEIIFIIAAATGRILVLPPEQGMYLLRNDGSKKQRGLDGFFEMGSYFKKRVQYITMEQFILKEGRPSGQFPVPAENMQRISASAKACKPGDANNCNIIHDHLEQHAVTANITATHHECLVFDKGMYERGIPDNAQSAIDFCSSGKRSLVYMTKQLNHPQLLYIQAAKPPTRMLSHYYGYLHFTDVAEGNYYKRYIRDLLHFRHEIFCAAGKIIAFLQNSGKDLGFATDSEGGGAYSSLHIRRGDFQYKKMKISDEEWYSTTQEVWLKNEILYIATDDKDTAKSFEPFRKAGHKLYFLNDFTEMAGLDKLDPNWMGMIDVVVASRGRAFAGTFRSTFTGYINRLRGYYGLSMKDSWFGQPDKKEMMHEFNDEHSKYHVNLDTYAKEWPDAWIGIDADISPMTEIY